MIVVNKFKTALLRFFKRAFSFEHDIDLNDEVEVLFRRNIVIKNIIFVANLVYTLILFIISIGDPSNGNWLWSVIPLPFTFVINYTINKVIKSGSKDLVRQEIAMYMCSFYMFLSAIFVYIKLSASANTIAYSEAGYMLLYFSLVVVSLYQNKNMLKNIFLWMFAIVTIIHFTLTHDFTPYASDGLWNFIVNELPKEEVLQPLKDIFFRTIVMLIFMLTIYVITTIGEKMSSERTSELKKRQEIQEDFANVVTDLYEVLLETQNGYDNNENQLPLLCTMSSKLATLYGLPIEKVKEIENYVLFNQNHQLNLNIKAKKEAFDELRMQTTMGAVVAKRMQLAQKCDNIVRAHVEGWATEEFKVKMLNIQNNLECQIILLCDIYIALRSAKSYKRPYPHRMVVDLLGKEFKIYFDDELFNRFIKFGTDFEEIFNNYED